MSSPGITDHVDLAGVRTRLLRSLESCAAEADIVQVLYASLHDIFDYQVVGLQVLEREGWYHSIMLDSGVLQDVIRRSTGESVFGRFIKNGKLAVWHPDPAARGKTSRGPGSNLTPQTVLWVPIEHHDRLIGAVVYQSVRKRNVSPAELSFLEDVHRHLGVLVANAYLNDTTRDQAVRLSALNSIARALSSTLDESGIVAALYATLSQLLPVATLELVVADEDVDDLRVLRYSAEFGAQGSHLPADSEELVVARRVLSTGASSLDTAADPARPGSSVAVPIKEGGRVRGVLAISAAETSSYEESTVIFLEQVADEVALAVRNAWSYAALEAQRRRLEVVNAVGRRLASSLDRWSIMRTLREELSRHLDFDGFILATIRETKEGPIAEGYNYASGLEQPAYAVPLSSAGPSREAYATRAPVLVQKSPWANSIDTQQQSAQGLVFNEGAAIFIAPESTNRGGRVATRSFVWVPVLHGERVSALLSLQSYREEAFSDWHVKLLQDVAAHVSLSLANAEYYSAAQAERRRLEALHVLELGVAGSADERQIAEAVFNGARSYMEASNLVLAYLDSEGRLTGFGSEHGRPVDELVPKPTDSTTYFKRLLQAGTTIVTEVPEDLRAPGTGWHITDDRRMPRHVMWIPIFQGDRVVAALSAQRFENRHFSDDDVRLLESAAPVVGIALRTVRLHRANELALAHSVRIQEVAALAGHDLSSVVTSIADQARNMLGASGVACWAFDDDGKVTAAAGNGHEHAMRVLGWSGRTNDRNWEHAPHSVMGGENRTTAWSLIPLWYGDRLVGAIGSMYAVAPPPDPGSAPLDFARHAAIGIENARLVAETRGRIHTLEAVAAFTELDITQPAGTRSEMALLIERALSAANGSLWLLDSTKMVRIRPGSDLNERLDIRDPEWFGQALRDGAAGSAERRLRTLLREVSASRAEVFAAPILVDGQLGGMLTVEGPGATSTETRRLMAVLAGQATVVLARLRLVDALDRERQMMDAILRHSPVGIILEDTEGRVVYANPEVEELYGVAAESMTGRTAIEIVTASGAVAAAGDPDADPNLGYELQLRNPDRFVQVRRVVIPGADGEADRILTLHEDITQERQVLEAKDLMLRAIGHEVRSPAAAMKTTLAGLVQWDQLMEPEQRRTLLHEAYEQSDRLLNLVENQLIIAKLETGRFEPNPALVPLSQTLEQVMQVLHHRYGERAGVVDVKLREGLPAAYCEPIHLTQVLTNLIGNALEYTTVPIHVTARSREGWLEITVADEGPGLPPERVETLFQKAGPAGQNRARGGLGLGLYLCSLVVQHSFGGRIWLEKTGRTGTTFKFTVQAAEQAARRQALPVGG